MSDQQLTHINQEGEAHMVDISDKNESKRIATAYARVQCHSDVVALLEQASQKKGDVLATARIAGIMAAKKTSELIPLCHPLALSKVTVDFKLHQATQHIDVLATCVVTGKTGVEMEALTAASVAALTLYDMAKAVDPSMVIEHIHLLEKVGGKTGHWQTPHQLR